MFLIQWRFPANQDPIMAVNSKSVAGRRDLNFKTFEDILADATALVASPRTKTLGNWPLDRLLAHLTMTFNCSIDGFQSKAPFFIRLIVPFFKASALKNKMSPGIQLPAKAVTDAYPAVASAEVALAELKAAIARTKTEKMEARHPAFGNMTHDEWYQLHLRHSEMHLSFAIAE
jgi:hypothetical protein